MEIDCCNVSSIIFTVLRRLLNIRLDTVYEQHFYAVLRHLSVT